MSLATPAYDPRMLNLRRQRLVQKLTAQAQQRPVAAARLGGSPSTGTGFRSSVFSQRSGGRPQLTGAANIANNILAKLGLAVPRAYQCGVVARR